MDKKIILYRMRHSGFFMTGLFVAAIILVISLLAPYIITFDPEMSNLREKLLMPGMNGHILGTDQLGRDIFSRLLIGSRYSFLISLRVVAFGLITGTLLGLISGYFGGWVDALIMRTTEVFQSVPQLVLGIAILAILGPSVGNLILVLRLTSWIGYCKLTRNNVLVQRKMEYVNASKCMGAGKMHIMLTQVLPNVVTQLLISSSQAFGATIVNEAMLSFLGLGIRQPIPSWGNMIADCRAYLSTAPWTVLAPGIALMLTVLAFNFLGDGLRDVLDPMKS